MIIAGKDTIMRHFRICDLPAARNQTVMRQLRILDLPAAADKLGTSFIIAVIVLALFLCGPQSTEARQMG